LNAVLAKRLRQNAIGRALGPSRTAHMPDFNVGRSHALTAQYSFVDAHQSAGRENRSGAKTVMPAPDPAIARR
jgi:hypothetical protein